MMSNFVVYSKDTGEISRYGTAPEGMVNMQAKSREAVLLGSGDDRKNYVDINTNELRECAPIDADLSSKTLTADGADSITITNLPKPCIVTLDHSSHEVTDGVFEFTIDLPGEYIVRVEAMHRLPYETTVKAT